MPASSAKKLSYAAVVSSPPPTDGPVSSTPAAPRASDDLVAGQDHLVAIPAPPKAAKSTKKAATGKSSKKAPVRPSPPSTKKKVVSPVVVVGQAVKSDPKNAVGAPSDPAVSSSKRANGHIVPVLGCVVIVSHVPHGLTLPSAKILHPQVLSSRLLSIRSLSFEADGHQPIP